MTIGNIVFFSGIGLLILTIILGIIFWMKKPQYKPESSVYDGATDRSTQKLRSGYPTDHLTIHHKSARPAVSDIVALQEETERLAAEPTEPTEPISGTEVLLETEPAKERLTEKLVAGLESPLEKTVLLVQADGTVPLSESLAAIAALNPSGQSGDTEETSGTTPLSGI